MLFHIISMIAFALIYSAYLGIAEGARDKAMERRESGRRTDAGAACRRDGQ